MRLMVLAMPLGVMAVRLRGIGVTGGIGMDHRGGQLGDRVHEIVLGVVGDAMRLGQTQGGVDVEFGVGV